MNLQKRRKNAILAVVIIALALSVFWIVNGLLRPNHNENAKATSDFVGISLHSLSTNEARMVNNSGAGWIRIDVSDYYGNFSSAIQNAKAYNLSVLAILDSWMFNKSSTFTLEDWESKVTYYVSKYADYVDAWEVWNEPANPTYPLLDINITNAYIEDHLEGLAGVYDLMAQKASSIIRRYDPTAKIILFGGLNLWSGNDPHLTLDKEFASQLAARGISDLGDAIAVHAYPWTQKVDSSIWQKYNDSMVYYQELYPSLEIWVTETGHPANFDGEQGQAQYLIDSLDFFNGKSTNVFWYSLVDNSWEENNFGLVTNDGTPRLSYYELQKATT